MVSHLNTTSDAAIPNINSISASLIFFCSTYAGYYTGNFFISSADAYGCKIEVNSATALAKPNNQQRQGYSTYSCTPSSSSTQYEVHVLSVYEVINRRPPTAGNANVNIVSGGKSNRPIVLVLASYEPVNWILHLPAGILVSKVILVSTLVHQVLKSLTDVVLKYVYTCSLKSSENSQSRSYLDLNHK